MKIYFQLPYETGADESLRAVLVLYTPQKVLRHQVDLESADHKLWSGSLEVPADNYTISYAYQVVRAEQIVRQEWTAIPRLLFLSEKRETYRLLDLWQDLPEKSWLYSTAFAPQINAQPLEEYPTSLILRVHIPGLTDGQKPFLCGEGDYLGNWKVENALPLVPAGVNEWKICLDASQLKTELSYKFIIKNPDGSILWELNGNRQFPITLPQEGETVVSTGFDPHFELTPIRAAGTVIPVFSIRTEKDWGIGDFGSLQAFIDWAASTGQKMVQILPVNDTSLTGTWQDSYPYNSVSVYAFHPIYADMSALPPLADSGKNKKFEKERAKLNALPQVDYEAVLKLKTERLRAAYEQEGDSVLRSKPFLDFWEENSLWLAVYAMFSALRDKYETADWHAWPKYSEFSENAMRKFFTIPSQERSNAYFYLYVQYVLHIQLLQAHNYARSKGVGLKGDIPIGVSPLSADAWSAPQLFHLNAQAGAPPDDFSVTGQNWGFPTYNWDEMAKDGYAWWKHRFAHMTRYFDAYRIDHVLGFFRIWEIPLHSVQGLLGQFSPALPLSEEEIRRFGFDFKPEHVKPFITDEVLEQVFGEQADTVRKTYVVDINGMYQLHDSYDTQRKIEKVFEGKTKEQELKLRDGLYELCNNVLFVTDHRQAHLYHPRISALDTSAFKVLPEDQQVAYTHLYNDYFYHRQDEFWKQQALAKLPALTQTTPMLCCAEDLGMIPHCVPEVMKQLQMLSLEIQRMPKQIGQTFAQTEQYPYLSVATPSTHDMSVLRGWWKENPELTQKFWNEQLHREGTAPAEPSADVCEQILCMHLKSPSMLCMIGWQDWTSMDENLRAPDPDAERINIPANPRHYWRYRMQLPVDMLIRKFSFNEKIAEMIKSSGR